MTDDVAPAQSFVVKGLTTLLQVFDMPASIRFYRDLLGFEVVQTTAARAPDDFDWAMLRVGDISLMLNTAYEAHDRPVSPEPHREASHGDVILYFACPDVDAAFRALRAKGIVLNPPSVAPYGMRQLSFRDPDGYGICLQWPEAS